MKLRRYHAEPGTCQVEACGGIVQAAEREGFEGITVRAFCMTHCAERDAELAERNLRGEHAQVILLADWERGPDGRAQRRANVVD